MNSKRFKPFAFAGAINYGLADLRGDVAGGLAASPVAGVRCRDQ